MSVSIKDNKETSIINIVIEKKDYENKVSSILNDYRKRANIPGFRKGFVPMGMIKKQYEIHGDMVLINAQYYSFWLSITEFNKYNKGKDLPL